LFLSDCYVQLPVCVLLGVSDAGMKKYMSVESLKPNANTERKKTLQLFLLIN